VGALFGLLAVTGAVMLWIWPDGPGTIIEFEKAGDTGAPAFLTAWTGPDGAWAALAIVLDFPFLIAYGFGGALLLDGIARWSGPFGRTWVRILVWLAWLPLLAAVFDVVEDVALLVVIGGETEAWPDLAHSMANVKFGLIYGFYAVAVVALVSGVLAQVTSAISRLAASVQRKVTTVMSAVAKAVAGVAMVSAFRVPGRKR
jgi:hypothetical protein